MWITIPKNNSEPFKLLHCVASSTFSLVSRRTYRAFDALCIVISIPLMSIDTLTTMKRAPLDFL
jgi:hypothetical protein